MIHTESQLESYLSEPTSEVIEAVAALAGDLLILGVGGKMGPTLAKQAKRAIDRAGIAKKVIGVSPFLNTESARRFARGRYRNDYGGSTIRKQPTKLT